MVTHPAPWPPTYLDDMTRLTHAPLPPLDYLDRSFTLDSSSPSWLRWATGKKTGQVAGYLEADGYWRVKLTFEGKYLRFPVHRIVYAMFYRADPSNDSVDHINGKSSNNPQNLRLAGKFGNQQNAWKRKRNATSRYKGVCRSQTGTRWVAVIRANGVGYHLGTFDSEEQAALAYNNAAIDLHGEFAFLNRLESSALG